MDLNNGRQQSGFGYTGNIYEENKLSVDFVFRQQGKNT